MWNNKISIGLAKPEQELPAVYTGEFPAIYAKWRGADEVNASHD